MAFVAFSAEGRAPFFTFAPLSSSDERDPSHIDEARNQIRQTKAQQRTSATNLTGVVPVAGEARERLCVLRRVEFVLLLAGHDGVHLDLLVAQHRPVARLHRAHLRNHGQPRLARLEPGRESRGGLAQQDLRGGKRFYLLSERW